MTPDLQEKLREEIAKAAELRAKTEQTLADTEAVAEEVEQTVAAVQREAVREDIDPGSGI